MKQARNRNRIVTLLLAAFFLLSVLLCLAFGETLLSHAHEDNLLHADCLICRQISDGNGRTNPLPDKAEPNRAIAFAFLPVLVLAFCFLAERILFTPVQRRDKLTI